MRLRGHTACFEEVSQRFRVINNIVRVDQTQVPISGQVDGASAAEMVDSGSITGRVKPKTIKKLVFKAFLLDVQQLNGQCEAFSVCGKQVVA